MASRDEQFIAQEREVSAALKLAYPDGWIPLQQGKVQVKEWERIQLKPVGGRRLTVLLSTDGKGGTTQLTPTSIFSSLSEGEQTKILGILTIRKALRDGKK